MAGSKPETLAVIAATIMSIKINNDNYDYYKKVFVIITRHISNSFEGFLKGDTSSIDILESWEKRSKSLAKKGLQSGLNDSLSTLKHLPRQTLIEINIELEKEELPGINKLRNVLIKTISKVLSNKKIKNIDQYYIIKEVLDDTTSDISMTDRMSLSEYLTEFELKQRTANNAFRQPASFSYFK